MSVLRVCLSFATALACVSAVLACNKDKPQSTQAPNTLAPPAYTPTVPQEPDPPQLTAAGRDYLAGHYERIIEQLNPLWNDLRNREQDRASGLTAGWLALAHAQVVFEDALAPAQYAREMATKTNDPEVLAMAALAEAAYAIGNQDYDAAVTALAPITAQFKRTDLSAAATIAHAEALIGRAYGDPESLDLRHPEDLTAARALYETLLVNADRPVLVGRANEGLAALAKYRGQRDVICRHVEAAAQAYAEGQAATFLMDGPRHLASENDCKLNAPR